MLFLPLVMACAEERPAINRVQANALSKEFFVGDVSDPSDDPVFFSRNMVIDASESQELVGISSASGLERIGDRSSGVQANEPTGRCCE